MDGLVTSKVNGLEFIYKITVCYNKFALLYDAKKVKYIILDQVKYIYK